MSKRDSDVKAPEQPNKRAKTETTSETMSLGALNPLKGIELIDNAGKAYTIESLAKQNKVIALYFSAHWCPPCRKFTPKLSKKYKELRDAGKEMEIIYMSSDKNEAQFKEYFAEMPWKALPHKHRALKETFAEEFEIEGIPKLFLLTPTGAIITDNGRAYIEEPETFPWTGPRPALQKLNAVSLSFLNHGEAFFLVLPETETKVPAWLAPLAEHYTKATDKKAAGEEGGAPAEPLNFIYALGEDPLAFRVASYLKVDRSAPRMLMTQLSEGKTFLLEDAEVNKGGARALLEAYIDPAKRASLAVKDI